LAADERGPAGANRTGKALEDSILPKFREALGKCHLERSASKHRSCITVSSAESKKPALSEAEGIPRMAEK
jgi:hypothetical protein